MESASHLVWLSSLYLPDAFFACSPISFPFDNFFISQLRAFARPNPAASLRSIGLGIPLPSSARLPGSFPAPTPTKVANMAPPELRAVEISASYSVLRGHGGC